MPPHSPNCNPTAPFFPSTLLHSSQIHRLQTPSATSATLETLTSDLTILTSSFKTRYFRTSSGRDAAVWLHHRLEGIINSTGGAYDHASVRFFRHNWAQPSVIARIQGSLNTTVILSTHIDSLNLHLPFLLPAPGANDNASGVAALLSIFSNILSSFNNNEITQTSLRNTLEFHFYAAEETGFWGSAEVFKSYNDGFRNVHSVLQFDTLGRVVLPPTQISQFGSIGIVNDFLDHGFGKYLEMLVNAYTAVNPVDTTCGYACSDHASAIRFGYPGALVTSGRLEDVEGDDSHTTLDTLEKLDVGHIVEFVNLGVGYAYELGFADLTGGGGGGGGDGGTREYLCDNGFPDGWMGSVRRFSTARAADPAGFGLWILVLVVLLVMARPWEEVPGLMRVGRRIRRGVRRGVGYVL